MARIQLENRIGIQAPAEVIWDLIYNVAAWENWNPMYRKARGQVRIGETLELELHIRGQKPQVIKPVVLDWVPNDHIHWKLSMIGGLIKSTRYLEIDILTETGCIFSNGEIFDGMLAKTAIRPMARAIRDGFDEIGEIVKARAEAAWREQQGVAT